MDLIILNEKLETIAVLDIVDSLIWTDRYSKSGDIEISTKVAEQYLFYLKEGYYVKIEKSDHVMLIDSTELKTNIETGNKLIVTGKSIETIINRRIVWNQTILSGDIESAIERLLNENIISPVDPDRKISNFLFEKSNDPEITTISVDLQFLGDNIYEVIENMCGNAGIGFKITIDSNKNFVFKLYKGKDRSYNQSVLTPVLFSPSLDNISDTKYVHSTSNLKTNVLVAGEGVSTNKVTIQIGRSPTTNSGINRREAFVDASDISMTITDGTLDANTYLTLLAEKGYISLLNQSEMSSFEGSIVASINYTLSIDFQIGDIVQTQNEYGISGQSRITEIIFSEDLSGIKFYPTFEAIN